jgi:hypothetical protein
MVNGNEADIVMDFEVFTFEYPPFKVTEDDPFHLTATAHFPTWMNKYIDGEIKFIFHKFLGDLLNV